MSKYKELLIVSAVGAILIGIQIWFSETGSFERSNQALHTNMLIAVLASLFFSIRRAKEELKASLFESVVVYCGYAYFCAFALLTSSSEFTALVDRCNFRMTFLLAFLALFGACLAYPGRETSLGRVGVKLLIPFMFVGLCSNIILGGLGAE
jgi:hypothetical protein